MQKGFTTILAMIGVTAIFAGALYLADLPERQQVQNDNLGNTIRTLSQWRSTSTPFSAITPLISGKNIYAPDSTATVTRAYATTFCINNASPDCITAWPSGGGGGGGGTTTVEIDGVDQGSADVLDFDNSFFNITESPSNDFDISLDDVFLLIGGDTATGLMTFSAGASSSELTVSGTATATLFVGDLTGNVTGALTGNADTATALAANGSNCSAGSAPLGVNASGAVESCTDYEEDLSNEAGLNAALSDVTGFLETTDNLSDLTNAATARTNLGVAIGSDVQAFDVVLEDLAALSAVADNEFIVGTGAGTYAHESGATARTSLGLGSLATLSTINNSNWSGDDLVVSNGGMGAGTFTDGGVLFGNGTGAIQVSAVLTNGQLLIGDGTTEPSLATLTAGDGIGISNGAGSITISNDFGTAIDLGGAEVTGTLDLSDHVNLTAGRSLTLTGDDVAADAELYTDSFSMVLIAATSTDDAFLQWEAPNAITITEVNCSTDAGTATIQLDERTATTPNSAGTDIMSSTLVCDTDEQSTASFANAGIADGALVSLDVDATAAGQDENLRIHVIYTIDD